MKLHHIAIWTFRLEELKDFYVRFLGGTSNEKYNINEAVAFENMGRASKLFLYLKLE